MEKSLLYQITNLLLENGWDQHSIKTEEKKDANPQEVSRGFTATFETGCNILTVSFLASNTFSDSITVTRAGVRVVQIDLGQGFPSRVIPTLQKVLEIIELYVR